MHGMRRFGLAVALVGLIGIPSVRVCRGQAEQKSGDAKEAPKAKYADRADPDYEPKVSDKAVLLSELKTGERIETWSTFNAPDFRAYSRSFLTKDRDQRREMSDRGLVAHLKPLTPVLVVELEEIVHRDIKGDDGNPETSDMATVRVLEGPMKGKKLCVSTWSVVRMIPRR